MRIKTPGAKEMLRAFLLFLWHFGKQAADRHRKILGRFAGGFLHLFVGYFLLHTRRRIREKQRNTLLLGKYSAAAVQKMIIRRLLPVPATRADWRAGWLLRYSRSKNRKFFV